MRDQLAQRRAGSGAVEAEQREQDAAARASAGASSGAAVGGASAYTLMPLARRTTRERAPVLQRPRACASSPWSRRPSRRRSDVGRRRGARSRGCVSPDLRHVVAARAARAWDARARRAGGASTRGCRGAAAGAAARRRRAGSPRRAAARIRALQVAGAVAVDALAQDQVLRARRRADRVELHEAQRAIASASGGARRVRERACRARRRRQRRSVARRATAAHRASCRPQRVDDLHAARRAPPAGSRRRSPSPARTRATRARCAGVSVNVNAISANVWKFIVEIGTACMNDAPASPTTPPTRPSSSASTRNATRMAARGEPERAQRADLAGARRDARVHRDHRADDRADREDHRDRGAEVADELRQRLRLVGVELRLALGLEREARVALDRRA